MHAFGSVYDLAVSEIARALCLDDVIGYGAGPAGVDRTSLQVIAWCLTLPRADFRAEQSCSASAGRRYQRFFRCAGSWPCPSEARCESGLALCGIRRGSGASAQKVVGLPSILEALIRLVIWVYGGGGLGCFP